MENWRLVGKRVIVTGAGSGIGRAIATLFVDAQADVIVFDLNGTSAQETAAAISVEASGRMSAIACDVSDEASIGSAFANIADGGDTYVQVNSAGVAHVGSILTTTLFPPSLHDWLPEGHLARFLLDVD